MTTTVICVRTTTQTTATTAAATELATYVPTYLRRARVFFFFDWVEDWREGRTGGGGGGEENFGRRDSSSIHLTPEKAFGFLLLRPLPLRHLPYPMLRRRARFCEGGVNGRRVLHDG
jgi:hypothetical protein